MGFNKPANTDVVGTFKAAIDRINALPTTPAFMLHTGDISHLSKPEEFDTVQQMLKSARPARTCSTSPASTTCSMTTARNISSGSARARRGRGWHSFDKNGVHFIGLVNVINLKAGGLGNLGGEQLEWLEKDVKHLSASTPIVVFAHIPLWSRLSRTGAGARRTARRRFRISKRFGSVTVLNGHIHQVMQKVEGNVTFHTAASTAFPQPKPGDSALAGADEGARPSELRAAARHHRCQLTGAASHCAGRRRFFRLSERCLMSRSFIPRCPRACLAGHQSWRLWERRVAADARSQADIRIDNFSDGPQTITVHAGTVVRWTNGDDIPHTVVSEDGSFKSKVMDTDDRFAYTFSKPGTYKYFLLDSSQDDRHGGGKLEQAHGVGAGASYESA